MVQYKMRTTPTDPLSIALLALADPTRRAILSRLSKGEATVNEIAQPFTLTLPAVSKHLRVLQKAGLVAQSRRAQWRPCRLQAEPLREVATWVGSYREFWDESLNTLDEVIAKMTDADKAQSRKRKKEKP